jgi:uncharacterized surface protein with fasciclin (FAS1) repeats
MKRRFSILSLLIVWFALWGMIGCDSKEEQYKRPEWLEPPIYQQLQEKGNFTRYLALVDKANYKKTLNGAGYYTVFAPTDDAFDTFFTKYGYASVDDVDSVMAKKIVTYSLSVSPASFEDIDNYQNAAATATEASKADIAFKRTTYNYKWVYADLDASTGTNKDVIDMNAVESEVPVAGGFEETDYNQKNIPFFTSAFMARKGLSAYDYNYFFPNTELTDFNVVNARVTERDLWAENGVIHVVDQVIVPLGNLEELLAETNDCSEFRNILNKYLVSYKMASSSFKLKYEQATGQSKDIYVKDYPYCSYALNCENYLRYGGGTQMDAQIDGWTLFAPSNQAMQEFYTSKFFKFGYKSLDEMPAFVILEFVNAHMFRTTVWPSKFATTTNPYGEEARFDATSDVFKREVGSNGLFYGVNKVQNTNAFTTVLGDIILNPNYSLMYQALVTLDPLVSTLKNPASSYLLFLITNNQMTEAGFKYNSASLSWEFTSDANRPDLGTNVNSALARFINLHIVLLNSEMIATGIDPQTSSGMLKTYGDEYVRFNKGEVYASGNAAGRRPRISQPIDSDAKNGQSYSLTRPILFSNGNLGDVLSVSSLTTANRATTLFSYLQKIANASYTNDDGNVAYVTNCIYNANTKAVKDIPNTDVVTVFLPNDPAILAAVNAGKLTPLASFAPDGNSNTQTLHNLEIERFLKYHAVKGHIVLGNDVTGEFTTYRKLDDGTFATLFVQGVKGSPGSLTVTDNQGRTANVITTAVTTYNILGNRAIVHVIDNYLTY